MIANKVFLDPRNVNFVFLYTNEFISYDSYITIDAVPANDSYVYKPIDGWNPSPASPNQGVIGFEYSNSNFNYGDTFVLVTSSGNLTVSNYLSAVDPIAGQLTDSLNSYINASVNSWVQITKTEWDNIAANVSTIFKSGASDGQIDQATQQTLSLDIGSRFSSTTVNTGNYFVGVAIGAYFSGNNINFQIIWKEDPLFGTTNPIGNYIQGFPNYNGDYRYYILKWSTYKAEQYWYVQVYNSGGSVIIFRTFNEYQGTMMPGFNGSLYYQTAVPVAQYLISNEVNWPILT